MFEFIHIKMIVRRVQSYPISHFYGFCSFVIESFCRSIFESYAPADQYNCSTLYGALLPRGKAI